MSSVAVIARAARLIGRSAPWYERFSSWRTAVLRQAMKPKKISLPGRTPKVMPRMFRRGYGLGMFRRKRRANRRRFGGPKKTQNKIHTFVRWADKDTQYPGSSGPNIVLATPGNQHLAYTFKLDNVVNVADFVNLYDSYRINKVVLYLERLRNSTGDGTNSPYNGKIAVVHDYNDANPLTDEDNYLEYSNCKRYSVVGNGPIRITLYPKINNTIENVGGSPGYISSNSNRIWLNTADDEVPHFGLKVFVPGAVATEGQVLFTVRAKFWLSMKNSK